MCPTVCENDRVLVATDGYSNGKPKRGDVIAFHFHSTSQIFIKRIVGMGGDSISLATNGTILVNGAAHESPGGCGKPQSNRAVAPSVRFAASAVPANSYFVIGDNLENSLDSRFEEFGFVTREQIVGKAVAVYWSSDSARIGCSLE